MIHQERVEFIARALAKADGHGRGEMLVFLAAAPYQVTRGGHSLPVYPALDIIPQQIWTLYIDEAMQALDVVELLAEEEMKS